MSPPAIRPRKSLGQNFLRDENIARKIIAAINPSESDLVVEIGPGEGVLTKHLAGRVKHLLAVEIDRRAVERLNESLPQGAAEILHEDFLKLDLEQVSRRFQQRFRVIGNIPYNITSPILFRILDGRSVIQDATLMIQKEVAARITAKPGSKDYGIPSVFFQLFCDVECLFDVSPQAFFPRPSVMSSVIHIKPLQAPRFPVKDEQFFQAMVRAVFGKRRKMLRNSLTLFLEQRGLPVPSSIDLTQRPEELPVAALVDLSNAILSQRTCGEKE